MPLLRITIPPDKIALSLINRVPIDINEWVQSNIDDIYRGAFLFGKKERNITFNDGCPPEKVNDLETLGVVLQKGATVSCSDIETAYQKIDRSNAGSNQVQRQAADNLKEYIALEIGRKFYDNILKNESQRQAFLR